MEGLIGIIIGILAWFFVTFIITGFYTVDQNQRAVKTIFGRAQRIPGKTTLDDPIAESLSSDELDRYSYPQVRGILPNVI